MSDNNERFTLKADVDRILKIVGIDKFDLDVAACDQRHWADAYRTIQNSGLEGEWFGNVFCNPPYDDLERWITKAWIENETGHTNTITMLIPANRCEQGFWQSLVEPYREKLPGFNTVFLGKRLKFGTPEDPKGIRKGNAPPFGCVLLIWRRP